MLRAVCCVLYAACCMLRAVCCVLYAACCMLRVVCCVLYAACCMLRAVCCVLYAACCMLRAVCCVLYAALYREVLRLTHACQTLQCADIGSQPTARTRARAHACIVRECVRAREAAGSVYGFRIGMASKAVERCGAHAVSCVRGAGFTRHATGCILNRRSRRESSTPKLPRWLQGLRRAFVRILFPQAWAPTLREESAHKPSMPCHAAYARAGQTMCGAAHSIRTASVVRPPLTHTAAHTGANASDRRMQCAA
jgi:hypothetical protein